ncbi:MAG: OadG family protein [Oscillospiraceae bacterium]
MPEYSNLFVVLMGLGTVFAGLLCIILLVTLMSWVCARTSAPRPCPRCRRLPPPCPHLAPSPPR